MYILSERSENKSFNKLFIVAYSMLMLIFYYGYVLLDNYRIHKSHDWLSKSSLTEQDFNAIEQFGRWVTTFETLFVVSFMIAGLFMHIFSRGNIYAVTHFLLLNTALFAGIALINYIILPVISLPIGNLMQPLSPALFILVLFLIDLLWLRIRTKAAFPQ